MSTLPEDWFEALKGIYPKRDGAQGWPIARQKANSAINQGADYARMLLGTQNYARYCGRSGKTGTELTMQAQRFYGPGQYWDEFAEMDLRTPAQKAEDGEWEKLEARARALGFSSVDRARGLNVARYAIEQAEKAPRLTIVK